MVSEGDDEEKDKIMCKCLMAKRKLILWFCLIPRPGGCLGVALRYSQIQSLHSLRHFPGGLKCV
jgi:hypothetical protein